MTNEQRTCQSESVEPFLQQQLSDEEQVAFELHLDDCNECRRQLEEAAAGDDVWIAVRDSLLSESSGTDCIDDSAEGGAETTFGTDTVLELLAPSDDERMLGRLGTYEVIGIIGAGGMGVVLKALDPSLNRYVAIKVLAPHLGNNGAAKRRFSREAAAAAAVVHDSVIEIHSVAHAGGLPYLVMPYVRGRSLQKRLDEDGPLPTVEILRIGMQAAAGLSAAHAQGLVHRDVKPANILLADGATRVKLTDFGLARAADDSSLTKTGVIAGTPQFMSPEQACGDAVDQRSDLFSLGSVMHTMCTGRPPFRAETSYGVLRRITDDPPRPIREINPQIPEWLCLIIDKLHAKSPDDRYQSATDVSDLLQHCLAHVQTPNTPLPKELRTMPRRNWLTHVCVVGLAGVLIALGAFAWQFKGERDPAADPAIRAKQTAAPESDNQPRSDDTKRDDVARLQGTWDCVSFIQSGRRLPEDRTKYISISFFGDGVSIDGPMGAIVGTFALATDGDAKSIDLQVKNGDEHKTRHGIFNFRDGQLWLCLADEGKRPNSFESKRDTGRVSLMKLAAHEPEPAPDNDPNETLALLEWAKHREGAGVAATFSLSIPGRQHLEKRSLHAGTSPIERLSDIPAFPNDTFTLRYVLPNLSPRGMEFLARNSVFMSVGLEELSAAADGKRIVRAYYFPDDEPEVKSMQGMQLQASGLNVGLDQSQWLADVDELGEIIVAYEITCSPKARTLTRKARTLTSPSNANDPRKRHPNRWRQLEATPADDVEATPKETERSSLKLNPLAPADSSSEPARSDSDSKTGN
ncbi:MAG: protein kinase [Planctomycetes bacterium]|nr:protein kinase [Planctomycetota bacterium]